MTAPGDSNSLMVQNLRPGTRYKFRVAAENRHGISPESQAVTTRMLDEGIHFIISKLFLKIKRGFKLQTSFKLFFVLMK